MSKHDRIEAEEGESDCPSTPSERTARDGKQQQRREESERSDDRPCRYESPVIALPKRSLKLEARPPSIRVRTSVGGGDTRRRERSCREQPQQRRVVVVDGEFPRSPEDQPGGEVSELVYRD